VPFAWHGPPCDRVLSWEIVGNARFLEGGVEKTRVENAGPVAVLPKGVPGQSLITAKVRICNRQTVTATVRFGTVSLVAEPVYTYSVSPSEPHINPCGLFVGDTAVLYLRADGVDPAHIHWSTRSGAVALGTNTTGALLIEQTISGASPGTDTVSANIDHLWGAGPPKYNLTVYAPEPPVPVHFMFICDNNGNHAGSASDIPGLISGANQIWRQAGMSFSRASVSYVTNSIWYSNSVNKVTQQDILNAMSGTGGLEVYFVPRITFRGNVPAANGTNGMLVTSGISSRTFAHELGHCCGLPDIYDVHPEFPEVKIEGAVSQARLPLDWNNGPGPEEYYERGRQQSLLVKRLLMYGYTSGGSDLTAGPVYGVKRNCSINNHPVGIESLNRNPMHQ